MGERATPTIDRSMKERPRAAAHDNTMLARLLSPITAETFVSEYWDKKSLVVRGNAHKWEQLFGRTWDRASFEWAAREGTAREQAVRTDNFDKNYFVDLLRAEFDHRPFLDGTTSVRPLSPITVQQLPAMVAAGATVRLFGLMAIDPAVAAVAHAVKQQLHYAGDVAMNSVLSPRSFGVNAHFDGGAIIIIQTAGRKRYFFSREPAVKWPRGKGFVFPDGTIRYTDTQRIVHGQGDWEQLDGFDESSLEEVTLEPGDMVYWPAGTVHKTLAEDGESLALQLVFLPVNFRRFFTLLLEQLVIDDPQWRYLPVALGQENGRLPASIEGFFGDRWSELTKLMSEVAPEGLEINRMWQEMVRPPQSRGAETADSADEAIARSDVFELSKHSSVSYAIGTDRHGARAVHLYCGDQEIEINGDWVAFYEELLQNKSFSGNDAIAWTANTFGWEDTREHIEVLLHTGVLRRVPQARLAK
jgi:ribosomal protein L16 Arg81 hydroxylase